MLQFILLQIEILTDSVSKYGFFSVFLALALFWIQKLLANDDKVKKDDRVRLLATLDRYEAKLSEHDKFKEDTIRELIFLLKENHTIIRETNEINKESIRILSILSNATKNSHSL